MNGLLDRLLEEKEMQLKGGIYHTTQVKFAYNSNRIEGSRLTEEQVRYIYETNTILTTGNEPINIDDVMETINHFQCFDYVLDHVQDDLSEEFIKEVHKILKNNTADSRSPWFKVGNYKSRVNMIGDTKTTPPSKVPAEMKSLISTYLQKDSISVNDIIEFHYNFEIIHPFQDGNGRVGRSIMFKECLKHNITPFIINDRHKAWYYRGLKEFKIERGYLIDTCLSFQDDYQKQIDCFFEE